MAAVQEQYQQVPEDGGSIFVKQASVEQRLGFVRKVYGILTAQVLLTIMVAAPIQMMTKNSIQNYGWIVPFSSIMALATICAMSCKPSLGKSYPQNYILLTVFTFFEAITIGALASMYTASSVLMALGMTMGIFAGLTVYAWTTKTDFSGLMPYLFGALIALCVFGVGVSIAGACGVSVGPAMMLYNFCGVLLFMFYIIFDTQRILGSELGGGHAYEFSIDEYVFAAITLYLDLINMFVYILSLFGDRK